MRNKRNDSKAIFKYSIRLLKDWCLVQKTISLETNTQTALLILYNYIIISVKVLYNQPIKSKRYEKVYFDERSYIQPTNQKPAEQKKRIVD